MACRTAISSTRKPRKSQRSGDYGPQHTLGSVQRLARRSAGRQVTALAEALSDSTLVDEEAAFVELIRPFEVNEAAARRALDRAWQASGGNPNLLASDHRLRFDLMQLMADSLAPSTGVLSACISMTSKKGVESVGAELQVIEQTFSKRYAGVAREASARAMQLLPETVSVTTEQWRVRLEDVMQAWVDELQRQLRFAALYGDTKEQVTLRLFKREPNSLKGNSGRGVWWRPITRLQSSCRAGSIDTMNRLREAAMGLMNEALLEIG